VNASDAVAIYVDFWFRKDDTETTDFTLYYYDGSSYDLIEELDEYGADDTWLHYSAKLTDSQYLIATFQIRFDATLGGGENVWVDDVLITKEIYTGDNYELDLEVQWTNVDFDETNEYLCIYAGTTGSEDLYVDYWTGSAWNTLLTDVNASSWNNVTVTLTSASYTIRFRDGSNSSDTTQDSWNIDVTLLHVWTNQQTMEVEFIGSSNLQVWSQLAWTVNSAWNVSSVSTTLQLYNHTLASYPTSGNGYLSYISSAIADTDETKNQTISVNPTQFRNATGHWKLKVTGVKTSSTPIIFKGDWIELVATPVGTQFTFENKGAFTAHLVSLWVNNATVHQRYDIDLFINVGIIRSITRTDIQLLSPPYLVKAVTERGNIAIYAEN
jgi:hypothetical protein